MAGFDYTEQVEGFIVNMLGFVRAFFRTTLDVALRPRRFAKQLSSSHVGYLKPYTFLTLATFSSVTITRYALIAVAVAVSGIFRGCTGETLVAKEPPALAEVLQLPSLETLIYVALPVVFFIIATGKLTDWLLLRRVPQGPRRISSIFLFVAGLQQLVIIPVLFAIYWAATAKPDKLFDVLNTSDAANLAVAVLIVIAAILLPACSLFRIGRNLEPPLDFRMKITWRRNLMFAVVAGLSATLSLIAIGGMAYWLSKKQIAALQIDVPLIAVTFVEPAADGTPGQPRFSVLLKNNGETDLWLKNAVVLALPPEATPTGDYACALVGRDLRAGLSKLPKGEVTAALIEVRRPLGTFMGGGGWTAGRLKFSALDLEGAETIITSRIHASDYTTYVTAEVVKKLMLPAESTHHE